MLSPRAIVDQYLELSSHDLSRMVYQLASNAVLEWNGLTVRGGSKIVKFLRQKQHAGQVQSFTGAVTTAQPFEVRDTHLATKANPPENLTISPVREGPIAATPSSPSTTIASGSVSEFRPEDPSFETPPKTLPALPHPLAPTGGRRFLPFPSDDEDEDGDDAGQSSDLLSNRQSNYSELQYLETVGTVRTANEPKHRGTRTTHHIPREDPSATSSGPSEATTSSSSSIGEKRTKLKLSYRTHLRTQEVQFALIIYEHISTRSTAVRRNLFVEEDLFQNLESPTRSHSPEPIPLPDSPPLLTAAAPASEDSPPIQPPGTPVKRRRIPPVIIGLRTSPRRSFAPDEGAGPANIQQTWPRKNTHSSSEGGGGGSASKQRKLSSASATIRKPLRF
ncbi:uncharacterized protein LOC119770167 [Culex quinquefasciatus]|uniref:uncharacterized protein LOC119770167 n=1 Tax=Culex quinquefasciatus TaxID=7176 RepID=UPI0018E35F9D|nr:uncharacterized protein LOC119770167 [Culex quinquefasciatus]